MPPNFKIKYTNGTVKIIPSILSRSPPWPGNIFPVSFIFAIRLKYETIKSPDWLINEEIKINSDSNNHVKNTQNEYIDRQTFLNFTKKIDNLLKNSIISDVNDNDLSHFKSVTFELLKKGY